MAETTKWAFPEQLQPRQAGLRFNLQAALDAAVLVRAEAPEDAFTAGTLGTERVGNGVVIRGDGLVLTIGYLITEAQSIWLTTNDGQVVTAHPVAYDQVTGFGLVMPLGPLDVTPLERGSARDVEPGDDVVVIGHGGRPHSLKARIASKREFAGYWEYVLDEALFTAPPHPQWGGAGLLDEDGRLLGIGSLLVEEAAVEGEKLQGNMFVPIDLLDPILDDMLKLGRPARPARPWLGMYAMQNDDALIVGGLAQNGPAARAGVEPGDLVLEVAGERVTALGEMLRKVWSRGEAGVEVPLTLGRDGSLVRVTVKSGDRNDYLKKPRLH